MSQMITFACNIYFRLQEEFIDPAILLREEYYCIENIYKLFNSVLSGVPFHHLQVAKMSQMITFACNIYFRLQEEFVDPAILLREECYFIENIYKLFNSVLSGAPFHHLKMFQM